MFKSFDEAQKVGKETLDVAASSLAVVSKGMQALSADAVDYTRKTFEASSASFEKLLGAKSLDTAFEIQADFARSAYEGFVAQTTRVGELVTDIAKESYKPFEGALSRAAK
jgi:hypothetical protein